MIHSWSHVVGRMIIMLFAALAFSFPFPFPLPAVDALSSYLDSLSPPQRCSSSSTNGASVKNNSNDNKGTLEDFHDGIPASEYYGLTNPMANNWAGSKHEAYGGYLKRLSHESPTSVSTSSTTSNIFDSNKEEENPSQSPDDWYGSHRPMASWQGYRHERFGGYLDALSSPSNDAGTYNDDDGLENGSNKDGNNCYLPQGKPSNYGNDVRWGSQVYLDQIEKNDGGNS